MSKDRYDMSLFKWPHTLHPLYSTTPYTFVHFYEYLYFLAYFYYIIIIVCLHRQPHCHTDGSTAQVIYYAQIYV